MRSAGFVLILGVKPCPRATSLEPGVHLGSRRLTSLAPQPLHNPAIGCRSSWSESFDRISRNERVTGSSPVSSTDLPWIRRYLLALRFDRFGILKSRVPHMAHKRCRRSWSTRRVSGRRSSVMPTRRSRLRPAQTQPEVRSGVTGRSGLLRVPAQIGQRRTR